MCPGGERMRKDKLFRASQKLEESKEFKNLPHNARDEGLILGWGTKIPQALGRLRTCAKTTEPTQHNKRFPHDAIKTQHSQIRK